MTTKYKTKEEALTAFTEHLFEEILGLEREIYAQGGVSSGFESDKAGLLAELRKARDEYLSHAEA